MRNDEQINNECNDNQSDDRRPLNLFEDDLESIESNSNSNNNNNNSTNLITPNNKIKTKKNESSKKKNNKEQQSASKQNKRKSRDIVESEDNDSDLDLDWHRFYLEFAKKEKSLTQSGTLTDVTNNINNSSYQNSKKRKFLEIDEDVRQQAPKKAKTEIKNEVIGVTEYLCVYFFPFCARFF